VERVRIEEARERAGREPVRRLHERAEKILPAQHSVREEIEAGVPLRRHEVLQVALDLSVHGFWGRPPSVEVARGLDELLRAGIDPWCKCLHVASLPSPYVCLERTERETLRAL